jgi:zinc protease
VKGTERRRAAQIASDAELLGGSVSASVGAESFGWGISVPRRHLAAAAELLADVVLHPSFPEEAFETERAIARAEVAHLRDDMYRYPLRLAMEAAFPAHPYGRSAGGTDASLAALGVARARAWHAERARRAASVIGVVGDVDPDEAASVLAAAFAALAPADAPDTPAPGWPAESSELVVERAKAQTAMALAFRGPARREGGREAAQLLAGIASGLGGRFFDELRDRRSLAYTVHAFASARRFAGLFGAYIATSPAQEETAREGLLAEFAKLREAPVTAAELEQARTYALGTHAIAQQSGGAVLGDMVDAWLFGEGLSELETYDARMRAVTAADIQALAERHFDPARRVEGVVRGVADAAAG